MTDDGRPRPHVNGPLAEDAPQPVRGAGSRRFNVIKPSEVAPRAPMELPPAWLPPKSASPPPQGRPQGRRLADSDAPAPVDDAPAGSETQPAPSLLERLETLTGLPRRVLGGAAAGVFAVVGLFVVAVGRPGVTGSHVFDDDAQRALAAAWRRDGPADWGGPLDDAAVVASVKRVGAALAPGIGGPVDVVVVAEGDTVHGFALPDGTVVLTTGLLWRLGSDAELAAVIAHLRAHQRLGHVAAALEEPPNLAERAATALARPKPGPDDTAVIVAVAAAAATHVEAHGHELDADADAADVLRAGGFDAGALRTALQRLSPPTAFGRSHPSSPARVTALAALPAGGRIDAERYATEVVGQLDRRRHHRVDAVPTAAAAAIAPPMTAPAPPAPPAASRPTSPKPSPRRAPSAPR